MRKHWLFEVFCGRRGATRDHEPRRGEGSVLPIRRRLAATRLETSSFARCATEDESSRRWRRVPAAHSGFFAAPGHERRLRGTRKYTKSPSSPSPRKPCSRGSVGRISIFHPCVLRLKTTRTTFSFRRARGLAVPLYRPPSAATFGRWVRFAVRAHPLATLLRKAPRLARRGT